METRGQLTRFLVIVGALGLVLVSLAPPGASQGTGRVLVISGRTAQPTVAFQGFDANPLRLFDIDGDGNKEIITQNDNQWVYVFDSQTGAIKFETTTSLPTGWGARSFNGPEVAVFSAGGLTRLIVVNSAAVVTSFLFDPQTGPAGKLTFIKEWEVRLTTCHSQPGSDSKPVFYDLDGDGQLEIIVTTEESGIYVLRSNGSIYWHRCIGGGNAEAALGDMNRDGIMDVVFGSDGGVITAMHGRTGVPLWSYRILDHFNLHSASIPVAVTVTQLDGLTGPDVIFGARDSHDPNNWNNNHALLGVLSAGGHLIWARQDPEGKPLTYTRPVVVDTDGDGKKEVYWADWNTVGHKPPFNGDDPPPWHALKPANFYRYDEQGNRVWRLQTDTWWQNKDVPLADVDGDGVQEMLANGPSPDGRHDGIWYIDTRDGRKETFVSLHPYKLARAPVVADLWNTGKMQWVVQVDAMDAQNGVGDGPAILVYDTGVPYNSAWPHPPVTSFEAAPPPTSSSSPPTSTATSSPTSTTSTGATSSSATTATTSTSSTSTTSGTSATTTTSGTSATTTSTSTTTTTTTTATTTTTTTTTSVTTPPPTSAASSPPPSSSPTPTPEPEPDPFPPLVLEPYVPPSYITRTVVGEALAESVASEDDEELSYAYHWTEHPGEFLFRYQGRLGPAGAHVSLRALEGSVLYEAALQDGEEGVSMVTVDPSVALNITVTFHGAGRVQIAAGPLQAPGTSSSPTQDRQPVIAEGLAKGHGTPAPAFAWVLLAAAGAMVGWSSLRRR